MKEINTKTIRNTRKALKEIKTKLKKESDNEELKKKKEFWESMLKTQKKVNIKPEKTSIADI